jgi:hypothetical protein
MLFAQNMHKMTHDYAKSDDLSVLVAFITTLSQAESASEEHFSPDKNNIVQNSILDMSSSDALHALVIVFVGNIRRKLLNAT